MIITINGIDDAGKSTLAKNLVDSLGYEYIDKLILNYFKLKEMIIHYTNKYINFKILFIIKLNQMF